MSEALYKYSKKGKKKVKGSQIGVKQMTAKAKARMKRVKASAAYKGATTAAERAAVMKKAGVIGRLSKKTGKGTIARKNVTVKSARALEVRGTRFRGAKFAANTKKGGKYPKKPTRSQLRKKAAGTRKPTPARGKRKRK